MKRCNPDQPVQLCKSACEKNVATLIDRAKSLMCLEKYGKAVRNFTGMVKQGCERLPESECVDAMFMEQTSGPSFEEIMNVANETMRKYQDSASIGKLFGIK